MIFSKESWQYALKLFQSQVEDKKYNKINYSLWKEFKNTSILEVKVWRLNEKNIIYLDFVKNMYEIPDRYEFYTDDCSFGSFLNTTYFENRCFNIDVNGNDFVSSKNEEENEKMNVFKGFEFGKVDGNKVHMSMYGLAIKNKAGTWVSYHAETEEIKDVDILNFNGENFMYKIPVALNQVKNGDVIVHQGKPMFITSTCGEDGNKFVAIDVYDGEEKIILASKSPFGFNFITKIVSLMDMSGMNKADNDNPFGNMWMFALMNEKDFDMKTLFIMNMMSNSSNIDPMMAFALMGDNNNDYSGMLMAMMMMNQSNKHECKCHQNEGN